MMKDPQNNGEVFGIVIAVGVLALIVMFL